MVVVLASICSDVSAQIVLPQEMKVPPSAYARIEAASGRALPCGACPIPIERAMRQWQGIHEMYREYPDVSNDPVEWPPAQSCDEQNPDDAAAPPYPPDGFYGDELCDPRRGAELVRSLLTAMHDDAQLAGAFRDIDYVDIEGEDDDPSLEGVYDEEIESLPEVENVTPSNYCQVFAEIEGVLEKLRYPDFSHIPGGGATIAVGSPDTGSYGSSITSGGAWSDVFEGECALCFEDRYAATQSWLGCAASGTGPNPGNVGTGKPGLKEAYLYWGCSDADPPLSDCCPIAGTDEYGILMETATARRVRSNLLVSSGRLRGTAMVYVDIDVFPGSAMAEAFANPAPVGDGVTSGLHKYGRFNGPMSWERRIGYQPLLWSGDEPNEIAPPSGVDLGWELDEVRVVFEPTPRRVPDVVGNARACSTCAPGTLTVEPNTVNVRVDLGSTSNGSSGYLLISADTLLGGGEEVYLDGEHGGGNTLLQTPACVTLQVAPSSEQGDDTDYKVTPVMDGGLLKQVRTPQGLVTLVQTISPGTENPPTFEIRSYEGISSQFPWNVEGYYTPTGAFHRSTIRVEYLTDLTTAGLTVQAHSTLRVTELRDEGAGLEEVRSYEITESAYVLDWQERIDNPGNPEDEENGLDGGVAIGHLPDPDEWIGERIWTTTTRDEVTTSEHTSRVTLIGSGADAPIGQNDRVELHELLDSGGATEASWELHFKRFKWGEELVKVVSDPGGEDFTTEIEFEVSETADGYRRPIRADLPDGGWREYRYASDGRVTKVISQRGSATSTAEATNDVIAYVYAGSVVSAHRIVAGDAVATSSTIYWPVDPEHDDFAETSRVAWPYPVPTDPDVAALAAIEDCFASDASISHERVWHAPTDEELHGRIDLSLSPDGTLTYTQYSGMGGSALSNFSEISGLNIGNEYIVLKNRYVGPVRRDEVLDLTDISPTDTTWAGGTRTFEAHTRRGTKLLAKTWWFQALVELQASSYASDWIDAREPDPGNPDDEGEMLIGHWIATERGSGGADPLGRVTEWATMDGLTGSRTYDCCGSASTTDAAGVITTHEDDGMGRLIKTRSAAGSAAEMVTEHEYDREGRIVKTIRTGTDSVPITVSESTYDIFNRIVETTDALGRVTEYTEIIDPVNYFVYVSTWLPDPDGSGPETSPQISEIRTLDGRVIEVLGSGTHPTKYEYGVTFDTVLDQNLEWTKEIRVGASSATTEWTKTHVDGLGRTVKIEFADGATERSYYNGRGELTRHVDADGRVAHYRRGHGHEDASNLPGDPESWRGSWSLTARADNPAEDEIDFDKDQIVRTREEYLLARYPSAVQGAAAPAEPETGGGPGGDDWMPIPLETGSIPVHKTVTHVWTTEDDDDNVVGVSMQYRRLDGIGSISDPDPGQESWSWSQGMFVASRSITSYPGSGAVESKSISPDGTYQIARSEYGRSKWARSYMDTATTPHSEITYGYDGRGRATTITDTRATTGTTDDRVTTYAFDDGDRTISVTSPVPGSGMDAQVTETEYDDLDRVIKVTLPDEGEVFYSYYPTGQLKLTYGARTYPASYTYDTQGRIKTLVTHQEFNESTGTGTSGAATTTWNYDSERGWLTSKIYNGGGSNGPAFEYWPSGRFKKRTWTSPRGVYAETLYDNFGQVAEIDYSDSTPDVEYTFDRRGRLVNVVDGVGDRDITYNAAGQMLTEDFTSGLLDEVTINNTFDSLLRRDAHKMSLDSTLKHLVEFGFETDSSRLKTVTKGNAIAQYAYTAHDYTIASLTLKESTTTIGVGTRTHDNLNRLSSIEWDWPSDDELYLYTYNDANQRTEIEWADGSTWGFDYDALGQVTSGKRQWSNDDFVPGQQFEYTFDEIGNRTQSKMGGDDAGGNLRTLNYTGNLLNQTTERTLGGDVDIMGYAPSTSTVTVNGAAVYRFVDYYQKLVGWTNTSTARFEDVEIDIDPGDDELRKVFIPKTPEAYTYDADGNLTQDGRWNYTWNGENQLVRMQTRDDSPAGLPRRRIDFVYDYMGRRCMKSVYSSTTVIEFEPLEGVMLLEGGGGGLMEGQLESPGSGGTPVPQWELISVTKFVWDGWNLTAELDGDDEIVRTYAWGLDLSNSEQGAGGVGGLLFEQDGDNGPIHRVSMDGNGNVMTLRDNAGALIAGYEYGPFGEALTVRGMYAGINPFRFSTKYSDSESGLYYYGYRYYSTGMGRWISRDPIGEADGNNIYAFIRNATPAAIDFLGNKRLLFGVEGFGAEMGEKGGLIPSDPFIDRFMNKLARKFAGNNMQLEIAGRYYHHQYRTIADSIAVRARATSVRTPGQIPTHAACHGPYDTIAIIGFSNGGDAIWDAAKRLRDTHNVRVDLVITIDPIKHVMKWLNPFAQISKTPNVDNWLNIYQTSDSLLRGTSVSGATNVHLTYQSFLDAGLEPRLAHFGGQIFEHPTTNGDVSQAIRNMPESRAEWRFDDR